MFIFYAIEGISLELFSYCVIIPLINNGILVLTHLIFERVRWVRVGLCFQHWTMFGPEIKVTTHYIYCMYPIVPYHV